MQVHPQLIHLVVSIKKMGIPSQVLHSEFVGTVHINSKAIAIKINKCIFTTVIHGTRRTNNIPMK